VREVSREKPRLLFGVWALARAEPMQNPEAPVAALDLQRDFPGRAMLCDRNEAIAEFRCV
jgi:hypothetical protein